MAPVTFYFDPLCPWAWMTSLWARELTAQIGLDVDWKFFSLAEVNKLDGIRYAPLQVCALARREGGNEAVERSYLALGRMTHERKQRYESIDEFVPFARAALEEVGLSGDLVDRALADPTTLEDVKREHTEAVERYDAFGVPWIVLEDGTRGFFGPVIGERLTGQDAVDLWEHFQWISGQSYLFELKRGRSQLPALEALSDAFVGSR